jgi:tetratricopeptide (TPR) repeat protein
MILRRRSALCILFLGLLWITPGVAQSEEDSASAHFERGVGFTKDKDYVAAMVEFKKAYALDPAPLVLFNIGQTANELKDYAGALRAYEQYLKDGAAEIDEERRKKVQSLIDDLRGKTANIGIEVNVTGASVAVDDVDVGLTPLSAPVLMNAGRRKISISKSGYEPLTRFVEIAGTEKKQLSFEIVSLSGGAAAPSGETPSSPPEIEHTPWPWIGLAATAGAAVATGVAGGRTVSKHSEYEAALATVPTSKDRIEDARSAAQTLALATDVLLGVTIAGAALTALAFGLDYGRSSEAPAGAPQVSVSPVVGPGFVGVSGAF